MIREKLGFLVFALAASAGALPVYAESGWNQLNMTRGVTHISREIYALHMRIFWICVVIGVVVFGAMIWSIITHRKSRGAVPDVTLVHNTKVEFTVKVTGFQWGWEYDYLDDGVMYYSRLDHQSDAARELASGIDPTTVPHYLLNVDHPFVVPVDTKVRLLVTGADVIHSWWMPAFGVKKDAIPGFVNEAWFKIDKDKPGLYRGQCAELCGRDHGFMPIVVDARSKEDFAAWLKEKAAEQKQAAAATAPAANTPAAAPTTVAAAASGAGSS